MLTLCCFAVCFVFLCLLSFACNCAGRRIIFFMVRLMIRCFVAYIFHGTVYDLMFCCLRACLLVRFLVSKYFLYVSVPVFWFVFGLNDCLFDWSIIRLIDRAIWFCSLVYLVWCLSHMFGFPWALCPLRVGSFRNPAASEAQPAATRIPEAEHHPENDVSVVEKASF